MPKDFIEIKGKENGPTSIIVAGVHGDETCGIEVFKKILPTLSIKKGCILFVYGNPTAIKSNVRFVEANLNRMFKDDNLLSQKEKESYEYKRAQILKKYFNKSEVLLDIHASSTPKSRPFIICEANAREIVKYLPIKLIVSGFDNIEPGGTDYYMNKIGKVGICIECGYFNDSKSIKVAFDCIIAFLKIRGHLTTDLIPQKQSFINMNRLYLSKTNFKLSKLFDDFEKIKKGQLIGIDGDQKILSSDDGYILFARNIQQSNQEAFLFGKK